MKRRTRQFVQFLGHEFKDEDRGYERMAECVSLIGWVVTCFNRLEKMVDSAICEAVSDRSDALGLLVIHGMQYGPKVEMLKRLCDDFHGCEGLDSTVYPGLIEKLRGVGKLRNLVVHADWSSTDADPFAREHLSFFPWFGWMPDCYTAPNHTV